MLKTKALNTKVKKDKLAKKMMSKITPEAPRKNSRELPSPLGQRGLK